MVEKATPLIEIDDEYGAVPCRTLRHRAIDLVHHRLAGADVTVWVVVDTRSRQFGEERSIDKRDGGKRAGRAILVERVDREADRRVLRAPQSQKRHIAVIVPARHTAVRKGDPDGGKGERFVAVREPIGLTSVLIDAIGE